MPTCEHCGRATPEEAFCTYCGAQRTAGALRPRWRGDHFAVHPGEHVVQPSLISTLLPHLPSHRLHEFRWGLTAGLAAIALLTALGQIVAAVLAAAVLVPVLYLVYLFEAQVYKREPTRAIGFTLVAGAVLGIGTQVIAGSVIPASTPLQLAGATGTLLAGTILLPIIQELVKPLPALFLRRIPGFGETIDGLVFGIAIGLGFAAAVTIYNFSRIIATEHLHSAAGAWLFPLLSAAVLMPVMQASCTGAITASLWRRGRNGTSHPLYAAGIPVALIGHVGFTCVSWWLADRGASPATVLCWQAAVDGALLVYIRLLLHRALLDEAEDFGFHPVVCPHCKRHVEVAAFCPHCGAAATASPRTPHGRLASDPRHEPGQERVAPTDTQTGSA